jgi:hypothetical protein
MQYGRGFYLGDDPAWYVPGTRRLGSTHHAEQQAKRDLQQNGRQVGDSEFDVQFVVAQGTQPNYWYDNMMSTVTEASGGTTTGIMTLAILSLLWVVSGVLLIAQLPQLTRCMVVAMNIVRNVAPPDPDSAA